MKKMNVRKTSEATKAAKARNETPTAPVVQLVPKAKKAKATKWDGDWNAIPSSRQLLALVIRSIETGVALTLPTTRDAAREALGYTKEEDVAKTG